MPQGSLNRKVPRIGTHLLLGLFHETDDTVVWNMCRNGADVVLPFPRLQRAEASVRHVGVHTLRERV